MKNIAITIFVVLIVTVLAMYLVSFQVRETESALVTRFGKPTREITEPGWYFKWPAPIERIRKFDSRMRVFEAELGETTTKGAVPIIVNTFIVWKIAEPLEFFNAVGTVREAESKLRSQLGDTQNKVIGQHYFSEFVNSDPAKIKFDRIQAEMLADIKQSVRADYGIEIKTLGIKQLKVSEDVSKDVFERMSAERNRKTLATIAQGNAQATRIKTDADSKRTELLAAAEARAKAIRGQGDAEAAKYYKMLDADPELAMFLRDIEALKKILAERSTLVFSADTEPFKLLKEIPNIKPANRGK
ncbi:MAG TPA: protease modulator HflC [Phycisphaerales bacterium]|nr:protease modulator HflC [Phycisphaerales bacterium]